MRRGCEVRGGTVVGVHHAGEHAGARLVIGADAPGVFERVPRDFEEQPRLRVHDLRLARRDPEQLRIEPRHVIDQACPMRTGVVERAKEVGPVNRHRTHGTRALAEQVPQFLGRVRARAPRADADHGDVAGVVGLVPRWARSVGPGGVFLRGALVRKRRDLVDDCADGAVLEKQRRGQPGELLAKGDGDLDDAKRVAAERLEAIDVLDAIGRQPQRGSKGTVHNRRDIRDGRRRCGRRGDRATSNRGAQAAAAAERERGAHDLFFALAQAVGALWRGRRGDRRFVEDLAGTGSRIEPDRRQQVCREVARESLEQFGRDNRLQERPRRRIALGRLHAERHRAGAPAAAARRPSSAAM